MCSSDLQNLSSTSIQLTESSFIEPDSPSSCRNPQWMDVGLCLAAWPDVGTRKIQTKFAPRSVRQVSQLNPDLFCAVVDEVWDGSVWLTIQVVGHLQRPISDYLRRIVEAGILPGFWDGLKMAGVQREFPVSDPRFVFQRLSFNTALLSVIKLYGILIAVAASTLALEIFSVDRSL